MKHKLIWRGHEPTAAADCSCGKFACSSTGSNGNERVQNRFDSHLATALAIENAQLVVMLESIVSIADGHIQSYLSGMCCNNALKDLDPALKLITKSKGE